MSKRRGPHKTQPALRFGAHGMSPEQLAKMGVLPPLKEIPAPPRYVAETPLALAEWQRAAPLLHELGLLTAASITTFTIYVMLVAEVLALYRDSRVCAPARVRLLRAVASDLRISPASQGFPPNLVPGPKPTDPNAPPSSFAEFSGRKH